mgnify:CR=1 FL=1
MVARILFAFLLLCSVSADAANEDAESILRTVDGYRMPFAGMAIHVDARTRDSSGVEARSYSVAFQDQVNTLVAFNSPPTNEDDLVLMSGDDIWFYAQDTRKPIRITPMQRLSGAVSYGDIARLSWSHDYDVVTMAEDTLGGEPVTKLDLEAKTRGATYQAITVWTEQTTYRPLKAEVYLASGKHFKTMTFTDFAMVEGKEINTEMTIVDHLNSDGSSQLTFSDIASRSWPNRLFIRTGLPDIDPAELR